MKVLMVCCHFPISIARYLSEGFKQAGHEVVSVGPAFGRWIPWNGGMELAEEFVWTPDVALDRENMPSIREVISQVGRIDLVIHGDSMIHLSGDSPVPNVVYMADNHVRMYDSREYDLMFGAHSWGFRHDEPNFRWLPCAYDPQEHYEWQPDWNGRIVDAGFVGVLYPNRQAVLDSLRSWGLSVVSATGKVYRESNDLYNVCKMAVCLSYNGDVPCRVFENAMQGCVVLCDEQVDLLKLGLENGKHLLTFNSAETLKRAVDIVIYDEGKAQEIVAAAKEKLACHTWQARAEEIIRIVFS